MVTTSTADTTKAKREKVERAVWMVSQLYCLEAIILALESLQFLGVFF